MRPARTVLILATLLAFTLGACGGGSQDPGTQPSGEAAQEHAAEEAARQIPQRDRDAYYQIATASGYLRSAAASAAAGDKPPANATPAALARARHRVAGVRPEDRGLRRLRARMLVLLSDPDAGPLGRAAGRRVLHELRAFNARLSHYLRREPAAQALLPD